MADYPKTKLEKALARRGHTSTSRPAWRELSERHDTVPSSKATQAPEVIQGFSGSWAAQYALSNAVRDNSVGSTPAQVQRSTNKLGQPGLPEINFRPYDWGTTRHGKYGPSLLGHPISFEVVGPTLKSDYLWHQWYVTEKTNYDELNIDAVTCYSTPGSPDPLPGVMDSLIEIYGLTGMPDEGLYLVVSMTGSPGTLTDNGDGLGGTRGGVGDGMIGDDGVPPDGTHLFGRVAVIPRTQSSKYEIFRVVEIRGLTLVLDGGKRLGTYFEFDYATETPIIRAITLLKPAATRVVAVPGSGTKGAEQVFAVVPPSNALTSDMLPLYQFWSAGGYVDPWSSGPDKLSIAPYSTGDPSHYDQKMPLPMPFPKFQGRGHLVGTGVEVPIDASLSTFIVNVDPLTDHVPEADDVGRILCIRNVVKVFGGEMASATSEGAPIEGAPELDRLLGYFEILESDPAYYRLRAISQVDPQTGVGFWFASRTIQRATGLDPAASIEVEWTIHEPIETLWSKPYLHPLQLEEARLKNLIDPRWVTRSLKARLEDSLDKDHLPDKAIFDTSTSNAGAQGSNANPGNLMDLGFRMVLFPAKVDVGSNTLVPDFDHPLDANELVLDPDVTGNQFVEVDYSAGLIYLSNPPVVGGSLIPDGGIFTADDNPRGEVVFFVSCVPFSREPGQMGANPRVTGGGMPGRSGSFCGHGDQEFVDAFGARLYWGAADQTITCGTHQEIRLDVQLSPTELPQSGFVDVVLGDSNPHGDPMFANAFDDRITTFGYTQVDYSDVGNGGNTTLKGVFGGGDAVTPATYAVIGGSTPATVVLRRDIITPNTADGRTGTDYAFDTTYGFARRASAVRFGNAAVAHGPDGSALVTFQDPRVDAHEKLFSELFSAWCISGGEMTNTLGFNSGYLNMSEVVVLIQGVRSVLPAQQVFVGPLLTTTNYLYIDGTDPYCPVYAVDSELPLPSSETVLIGRFVEDGVDVIEWYDLRQPLVDIDKRLDVTVGIYQGHGQPGDAHFNELADAVQFVVETMAAPVQTGKGSFGQTHRIRVIGQTIENQNKLPIAYPGVNGITIEGDAGYGVGTGGISWSNNVKEAPLFDLSGCSGWTFRNVTFAFGDFLFAPSATPKHRTLAVILDSSAGDSKNILFENVTLNGGGGSSGPHGFLWVDDDLGGGTGFDGITLRNCVGEGMTDFAVHIKSNADGKNLLIEGCKFTVDKGADQQLGFAQDGAILYLSADQARRYTARDNYLVGGPCGILVDAYQNFAIENNYIDSSDWAGIRFNGTGSVIRGNKLHFVHTKAKGLWLSRKTAIYCTSNSTYNWIEDNDITISGGTSTDQAITGVFGSYNVWSGNVGYQEFSFGDHDKILFNRTTGNLNLDGYCEVHGNYIGGLLKGSGSNWTKYSNNWFAQDDAFNHSTGVDCTFIGDWFGDPSDGTSGGRVTLSTDCTFLGCRLADGFSDGGAAISRVRLSDCDVDVYTALSLQGGSHILEGNRIMLKATGDLTFTATDLLFAGNVVDIAVILAEGSGHVSLVGNRFMRQNGSGYCVTVNPGVHYTTIQNNTFAGGLLAGSPPPYYVTYCRVEGNRQESGVGGSFILYASNSSFQHNNITGGVGIQGPTNIAALNHISGTQNTIQLYGGGALVFSGSGLVQGNTLAEKAEFLGAFVQCIGNRLFKGAYFVGNSGVIQGNYGISALYLGGSDLVVQGNTLGSILAATSVHPSLVVNNGTISGNKISGNIHLGKGSNDTIIADNQVGGVMTVDNVSGTIWAAHRPVIRGNYVGGDIVCATAVAGPSSAASQDPIIHGNSMPTFGSKIICCVNNLAGSHTACLNPSIQGNKLDIASGEIYVGGGYQLIGNMANRIALYSGSAGSDPDPTRGIVMGNRITTSIFGSPTWGASAWDKDSGMNTGHIKVGNIN